MNLNKNVMLLGLGLLSFGILYPTDAEEAVISLVLNDYDDVDDVDKKALRTAVATIIHSSPDKEKLKGLTIVQKDFKGNENELAVRFSPEIDAALEEVAKNPTDVNAVRAAAAEIAKKYAPKGSEAGNGLRSVVG